MVDKQHIDSLRTFLGFAGDVLTFVGSLVLSYDAFTRSSQLRQARARKRSQNDLATESLTLSHAGRRRAINPSTIEEDDALRSVTLAKIGGIILSSGFLVLLVNRILEGLK